MSDVRLYTRRDLVRMATIGIAGTAIAPALEGAGSAVSPRARSLVTARGLTMGGKDLPYDYKVEWLESTTQGVQFIDTGITLSRNHAIEADAQIVRYSSGYQSVFGDSYVGELSQCTRVITMNNNPNRTYNYFVNTGNSSAASLSVSTSSRHVYHLSYGLIAIDGLRYYLRKDSYESDAKPFILFHSDNATATATATKRIWSFKVYESKVLKMHLVPVVKGSIGMMYDEVTGVLFQNGGTYTFSVGPRVD